MAATKLIGLMKKDNFKSILEIGCGTGSYTLLLRNKFKGAEIKAIDISAKMIEMAQEKLQGKDIEFITGDAENLPFCARFDLITSNACFQWFRAYDEALLRYKLMLKKDGELFFSSFGPKTFRELNLSLKSVLEDNSIAADGFLPKEKIKKILLKNFKAVKSKEIKFKESFPRFKDLLDKIKWTGATGGGLKKKTYLSRPLLKEIEKVYLERFKEIVASYQVFFFWAKK
ncbi:MAG: methyltransferase domain-containing protein [Candidatus Omnitrophota bacterium]|nr:methyltransferase domain-containing protein [Candidatus Omnitrophota bacterium]